MFRDSGEGYLDRAILVYCPRISKNTPTKEGENKPENAKTDLKPFYTISEPSMRASMLSVLLCIM